MATYDPPSCIHGFSGNGAGCEICELAAAYRTELGQLRERSQEQEDTIRELRGERQRLKNQVTTESEAVAKLRTELATVHTILTDDEDESVVGAAEQRMRDLETWKECSATDSERAARAERAELDARKLRAALVPFVNVVLGSSGRIPTERLSFADWHALVTAYGDDEQSIGTKGRERLARAVELAANAVRDGSATGRTLECLNAFAILRGYHDAHNAERHCACDHCVDARSAFLSGPERGEAPSAYGAQPQPKPQHFRQLEIYHRLHDALSDVLEDGLLEDAGHANEQKALADLCEEAAGAQDAAADGRGAQPDAGLVRELADALRDLRAAHASNDGNTRYAQLRAAEAACDAALAKVPS